MTRSRTLLMAGAAMLVLAGCGSGEASQSEVEEDVTQILLEDGFEGQSFDQSEAEEAAECVAENLFDPDAFTPEERNEVVSAADAEPPPEDLENRVVDLVDGCVGGEPTTSGPDAP
jgi:hypothetical protein